MVCDMSGEGTKLNTEDRLERNTLPESISDIYVIRKNAKGKTIITGNFENGWIKMSRLGSLYHRNKSGPQGAEAVYNVKFVRPDIYGGAAEAVICFPPDREPYLVEDDVNGGTYNFVSPYKQDKPKLSIKGVLGHLKKDLLPYLKGK